MINNTEKAQSNQQSKKVETTTPNDFIITINKKRKEHSLRLHKWNKSIEQSEFLKTEHEIDQELKLLGIMGNISFSKTHKRRMDLETKLIKEEEVQNYLKQLKGQSSELILQKLILKYENDESLKIWIDNWKNFLSLSEYAEDKPPAERKAIKSIISKANFTEDNSFDMVLTEIEKSSDISNKTKLEISRKFKTNGINTIGAFDHALKQKKKWKNDIEKSILYRNSDISNLKNEIQNLNNKLDKLIVSDPKRDKIQEQIKQKEILLKTYKSEIIEFQKTNPKIVQFLLRTNIQAILNPNGSRSVKMLDSSFIIDLPENSFLMNNKNLRTLNLTFPFMILLSQNMTDEIFPPGIVSGSIPNKRQRRIAHFILSGLGFNDKRIITEDEISQLKEDLSMLQDKENQSKTGQECLVEIGVWDCVSQKLNEKHLRILLEIIKKKRGENLDFKKLKAHLKK